MSKIFWRKRLPALLICAVMIFGLLPEITLPASAAGETKVYEANHAAEIVAGQYLNLVAYCYLPYEYGNDSNSKVNEIVIKLKSDIAVESGVTVRIPAITNPNGREMKLTIDGNGYAIYRSGTSDNSSLPLFEIGATAQTDTKVPAIEVEFKNITLQNSTDGSYTNLYDGSAHLIRLGNGVKLTLGEGTTLARSFFEGNGGFINRAREWFPTDTSKQVTGLTVSGTENSPVIFRSSGVGGDGGAIFDSLGAPITINHAEFTGTSSSMPSNTGNGHGGAIYTVGDVSVSNTTFRACTAKANGGAIFAAGNVELLAETYFHENSASASGGAIYSQNNIQLSNAYFFDNTAGQDGGALWCKSVQALKGSDTIKTVVITRCKAGTDNNKGNGGGIYCLRLGGPGYTLYGVRILENTASGNGGGVHGDIYAGLGNESSSDISSGKKLIIENNTAGQDGGGVYSTMYSVNPHEQGGASVYGYIFENKAGRNGGGIYIKADYAPINDMSIIYATISGNRATSNGGGIYLDIPRSSDIDKTLWISDTYMASNRAEGSGGAIYDVSETSRVSISRTTFFLTSAKIDGGGVYKAAGELTLSDGTYFNSNTAASSGGAVFIDNATLNIYESSFLRNSAPNGSGVYNYNGAATIYSGIIFGNGSDSSAVAHGVTPGALDASQDSVATIIAWKMPETTKAYTIGSSEDLNAYSNTVTRPRWAVNSIEYISNGAVDKILLTTSECALIDMSKGKITAGDVTMIQSEGETEYIYKNFSYDYGKVPKDIKIIISAMPDYGGSYTVTYKNKVSGAEYDTPSEMPSGTYEIWLNIAGNDSYEAGSLSLGEFKINALGEFGDLQVLVKPSQAALYTVDLSGCAPDGAGVTSYELISHNDPGGMLDGTAPHIDKDNNLVFSTVSFSSSDLEASFSITVTHSTGTYDLTVSVSVSEKIVLTIGNITPRSGVYDGNSHTGFTGTPEFSLGGGVKDVKYVVTYNGSATPPIEPGNYTALISVAPDNADYAGSRIVQFAISPAILRVTAENVTVSYGALLPTPVVSYSGFVGNHSASDLFSSPPVAAYSASSQSNGGQISFHSTVADGASTGTLTPLAEKNYEIRYVSGALTVTVVEIPEFQLTTASPSYIYGGATRRLLTLSGNNLDKANEIEIVSGGKTHTITIPNAAVTLNETGKLMTVDLAQFGADHPYNANGEYNVRLKAKGGAKTASRTFRISNDEMYSQDAYSILVITQNKSTQQLEITPHKTEEALASGISGKTVLVTLRGRVVPVEDGKSYRVIGNTTINKALEYMSGANHAILVTVKDGDVTIQSEGYTDTVSGAGIGTITNVADVLTWQSVPVSTCGFKIELDNAYKYRSTRLQSGTYTSTKGANGLSTAITDIDPWRDVIVKRPNLGSSINLYVISASLDEIHLFDGEFTARGDAKLNLSLPEFISQSKSEGESGGDGGDKETVSGGLELELKDVLLRDNMGFPEMWLTGKAELNLLSLLKGEMNVEMNSLPETDPWYFGMSGNLDLKETIYLEGEFIFTYKEGRFLPEKLEFFARNKLMGIPIIPPIILASAYGFGGGVDGISRTVYGSYSHVPPLSIKAMAAIQDSAGGVIFDVKKATFTFGPSEMSLIANEATFLKVLKLENYGWRYGFRDPEPAGLLPDPYIAFGGKLSIGDLKAGPVELGISGEVSLDVVLHSYYIEDTVKNLFTKFVGWASGENVEWTDADTKTLASNLILLIDAEGTAAVNAKIKLWGAELSAGVSVGIKKSGMNVTLSGSVFVKPLSFEVKVSFVFSVNIETGKTGIKIDLFSHDAELTDEQLESLEVTESLTLTNLRDEGSFTFGSASGAGRSRLLSTSALTKEFEDEDTRLLSFSSTASDTVITIRPPEGVTIDLNEANKSGFGAFAAIDGGFDFKPDWTLNDETGLYEGGIVLAGKGEWRFETGGSVTLDLQALTPLPELLTVTVSEATAEGERSVALTYDDRAHEIKDELYAKVFLLDSNEKLVQQLTDQISPPETDGTPKPLKLAETYAFTMPGYLDSGSYIVQVQIVNANDEVQSALSSAPFTYNNPKAPGAVTGVNAVYSGNGAFEVSWTEVADADGYTVTILDKDGETIEGIADIDVSVTGEDGKILTSILVGGGMVTSVTIDPDTSEEIETEAGLPFGANYNARVRAYTLHETVTDVTASEEDKAQTKIHGAAGSKVFNLPVPESPELTVAVDGGNEGSANVITTSEGDSIYATNDKNGDVTVTAEKALNWEWAYEDVGDPQYDGEGTFTGNKIVSGNSDSAQSITLPIPDIDGIYTILVEATGALGDITQLSINLWVDTSAPTLEVDEATSEAADGNVVINGLVEYGSTLYVDGEAHATDTQNNQGGLFSVERSSRSLVTPIILLAVDPAGNSSSLSKEMVMMDTGKLIGTELRLEGGRQVLGVGKTEKLELWAVYDNGVSYIIDSKNDVSYSIVDGASLASLGQTNINEITAGNTHGSITVQADWKLDDENTLNSQVTVSIGAVINAEIPTISSGPRSASYTNNAAVQPLSVTASSSDGGTLSYQWYQSASGNTDDGYLISGATDSSYTPSTSDVGVQYYYCVVTNTNTNVGGEMKAIATSAVAAITVSSPGGGGAPSAGGEAKTVTTASGTVITLPADSVVNEDGTITVGASGATVTLPGSTGIELSLRAGTRLKLVDSAPLGYEITSSTPFTDTPASAWYSDDVLFAYAHSLFEGTGSNTFAPEARVTRGMLVTVLYRLIGEPSTAGGSAFNDVAPGAYYTAAVSWAVKNGIVHGYGDGNFGPDDSVTREQMATIFSRFLDWLSVELDISDEQVRFADESYISEFAKEAFQRLYKLGIINGVGDDRVAPTHDASRAQLSAMLTRLIMLIAEA